MWGPVPLNFFTSVVESEAKRLNGCRWYSHPPLSRGGFVEHLSRTYAGQQSVTQYTIKIAMFLVTPKAGAKHELLFNKPALGV